MQKVIVLALVTSVYSQSSSGVDVCTAALVTAAEPQDDFASSCSIGNDDFANYKAGTNTESLERIAVKYCSSSANDNCASYYNKRLSTVTSG